MAKKRIKIVIVINKYYPLRIHSGALRFFYNLCERLSKRMDIAVISYGHVKNSLKEEDHKGYKIFRTGSPFSIRSALIARKLSPDLIIFATGITDPLLMTLYFLSFKLFVYRTPSIVEQYTICKKRFFYFIKFLKTDRIVCTSPTVKHYFERAQRNKTFYIPPGVNVSCLDNIKPEKKEKGKVRIGFFGHLDPHKGADRLLDAFIKANISNSELLIAGEGCLRSILEKKSNAFENVRVYGYLDNVESYIKSCDIIVLPYRSGVEILGLALTGIEAMAMGKVLIGSRDPSVADIIKDRHDGLIFNDEEELIYLIREVCINKELRKKLGKKAREKVILNYSIKKIEKKFYRLIMDTLKS